MGFFIFKWGFCMLKFKRESIVVYFVYDGHEYRRIDGVWEVHVDSKWNVVDDTDTFELVYNKRCKIKELIKLKDRLKRDMGSYVNNKELNDKYSNVVQELMGVFGIMTMISNSSEQLSKMLDEGKIFISA